VSGGPGIALGLQLWGQAASWAELIDAARAIEAAGLDSVWSNDHFLPLAGSPDGIVDDLDGPCFEGWMLLAGFAAATTRVRLGCLVSGAGYRNPALLVKMATALDHGSGGRVTLGLGAGWFGREHEAFGFEFPPLGERLDRLEEAAAICRALLDGERVTLDGRWFRVRGAVNDPPPVQSRLPLLIGGSGERRTLRIVARHADAWNADGGGPEEYARKSAILDEHCRTVGRDPRAIRRTAGQPAAFIRETREASVDGLATALRGHGIAPAVAWAIADASPYADTAERVANRLRAMRSAGCDEVVFDWPAPFDRATLEALAGPVREALVAG
jgi:F420-dependent oxidoreductase-like protein